MATYGKIRKDLKTGDLLLFSGKGGFSETIKTVSNSKWSHVGMVYRAPDRTGLDSLMVWESSKLAKEEVKDAKTRKLRNGVQTLFLSDRIRRCLLQGYELSFRQLDDPLSVEQLTILDRFRHKVMGRPYEKKLLQLLNSALDIWGCENQKEDLSSIFCSELVAAAYMRMELLAAAPSSSEYTPNDFSSESDIRLNGNSLGKERKITGI